MSAYLLHKKEIKFKQKKCNSMNVPQLNKLNTKSSESRQAEVEVEIDKETIREFAESHQTSQNWRAFITVKQLIEPPDTLEQKKTVKISLKNDSKLTFKQLMVDLESEFLKDIMKTSGKDIRLKVEILEAKSSDPPATQAPPSSKPPPLFVGGSVFSIPSTAPTSSAAPSLFGSADSKISVPEVNFTFGKTVPLGPICYATADMIVNQVENSSMAQSKGSMMFPSNWSPHWLAAYSSEIEFTATINLIVSFVDKFSRGLNNSLNNASIFQLNKKLLQDKIQTDMEIIAKNGKAIKCHSAFIAAQSEVLKSEIENMKEGNIKITLADVSEDGVNNLLAYLYYRDIDNPLKFCSAAVELLQVGHKYLINYLVDDMKKILLEKPFSWFDPDWTLRLFFFSNSLLAHIDLKSKAIGVFKMKPSFVTVSEEYKRLFSVTDTGSTSTDTINEIDHGEQLQLAKELCTALLFSANSNESPKTNNVKTLLEFVESETKT